MYFETTRDQSCFYYEGDNCCIAHFHRSTEVLYGLRGTKTVWLNGQRYDISPAQLLVCPPYTIHVFPSAPDSVQIAASIMPEDGKRFESFSERYLPVSHVLDDKNGELLGYLRTFGSAENETLRAGAAAMMLGTFMARAKFVPAGEKTNRSKIQEIAEFIDAHYAEPLTLALLASTFGYSRNYFSALFQKYFRSSFSGYVNFVRVQKSLPALKTQKISSVYLDCGFQSPQQYFLNFKKYFGCTPYEYLHERRGASPVEPG